MADKKYGIFRIEKIKLSDGGEIMNRLKHAYREFKNTSFDPELTKDNYSYGYNSSKDVMQAYKEKIKSITTDSYKPPKNSVGIYECIVTSTAGAISKDREREFFEMSYAQLCKIFGRDNILAGVVHYDETTPHTHWYITPIFETTSVLRRTREEKQSGTCRTITQPQLNATHWTGSPALLSKLQDCIWEGVFKHFGLERGDVESMDIRTKKKKNVRSDIKKRDKYLSKKEQDLKEFEHNLDQRLDNMLDIEYFQHQKEAELKEKEETIENGLISASKEALKQYEKLKGSEIVSDSVFPQLPVPEKNENAWQFLLKVKPVFDAVISIARNFMRQIKELKQEHKEEINNLTEAHKLELSTLKQSAESDKENAIKKERKEKDKWYNILYKRFTYRLGNQTYEVNQGLTDVFFEKANQLEKWENRDGDELISLGNNYKKYRANNWKEYIAVKSKHKQTMDYEMEW